MTHAIIAATRIFSFAGINHVALVHGDEVIEAVGIGRRPYGVRKRSLYDFMQQHKHVSFHAIPHHDPDKAWVRALSQVGKRYDYWRYVDTFLDLLPVRVIRALLKWATGFEIKKEWDDPDKLRCEELIFYALGWDRPSGRLTPNVLLMLSKEVPDARL